MEALYDFLISPQFSNSVTALLENFRKSEKLISKEKEAALKSFAEREAHLWASKRALLEMYGKIGAIASDGLNQLTQQVKILEEPNNEWSYWKEYVLNLWKKPKSHYDIDSIGLNEIALPITPAFENW